MGGNHSLLLAIKRAPVADPGAGGRWMTAIEAIAVVLAIGLGIVITREVDGWATAFGWRRRKPRRP
jgi:hypothetical protein